MCTLSGRCEAAARLLCSLTRIYSAVPVSGVLAAPREAAYGENHTPPYNSVRTSDASEELDPARVWPDVASTIPVTIMVHGKCLTLPPRGTLMKLSGPWKQGWKAITQRNKGGDG